MSDKNYQTIFGKRFFAVMLLAAISIFTLAGCKTGLFNSGTASDAPIAPPEPPAPVVVDGIRTSYADIVQKTAPAVVSINSERKAQTADAPGGGGFFDQFPFQLPQQPRQQERPQVERGVGSGVIVSADGTVMTNNHVVQDAVKITVEMNDGKSFQAKVVGLDPPSDLAVLKIEGENLPFLNLGNSDNVRVGDIVLAIGNPLGIGQTVTGGIISAKGRRTGLSDGQSFEDFLQTDAPINRGNSGGALVNLNGELIGINSQILSGGNSGGNIGIGFAIPSNMAKTVMEQLVQNGKVRRGMLGIGIQPLNETLAESFGVKGTKGVLVNEVRPGSAADNAGFKVGDVITAINGEAVDDPNILRNKIAGTLPGTEVKIKIKREESEMELTATLGELESAKSENPQKQDEPETPENNGGKLGLTLQPVTPQIARQLEIPEDTKGLVVSQADPGGAAAQEGIQRGDVILEVNRQPVNTLEEMKSALDKSGDNAILLRISRRGQAIFLTVKPN